MLRTLWDLIRLPVLAVLTLLEGTVTTVLGGVAFFGLVTALFFRFATSVVRFPFWTVVGVSSASAVALVLYFALCTVLMLVPSRDR